MFAHLPRPGTHLRTAAAKAGTGLGRLAAILAAVTCGLLASAVTVPAAFAVAIPDPGGQYRPTRVAPVPAATVHAVTADSTAGWQIALIAIGAALAAAAAIVLLDRARAARRPAPAPTA